MLTVSTPEHVNPSNPRRFGNLIQDSMRLGWRSLRTCWLDAMIVSLLPQLPLLVWWWNTRERFAEYPLTTWLESDLFAFDRVDVLANVALNAISLLFFLAMLHRQGVLLRGEKPAKSSWAVATQRFLPACLATLTYFALMALALAPIAIGWLIGQRLDDPMMLLIALLVGLLVAAAPSAWISIAGCFIYPPILLDGQNGWSAQWLSFRLVRGQWARSAGLLTLVTLMFLGILSAVGSIPFFITASIATASDGMQAMFRPGWLIFGQLLSTPVMALLLPMATAAYWVMHEELKRLSPGAFNAR